jgi:histidine ammonia-lyase
MNDFDRMIDIDDFDQLMGKRKNTISELAYDIDEVSAALREHAEIMERRIEYLDDKLSVRRQII